MRLLAMLCLTASAMAIVTDVAGAPLEFPTVHSSTATEHTITMTLSRYLYNGPDGLQQWTRTFNGELAGPTLRIKPGDTFHITLVNNLESEAFDTSSLHNNFKDFDTTNVRSRADTPRVLARLWQPTLTFTAPTPFPRSDPHARTAHPRRVAWR